MIYIIIINEINSHLQKKPKQNTNIEATWGDRNLAECNVLILNTRGLVLLFLFCLQGSRCNALNIYGHFESRSLSITLLSNYTNCIDGG